MNSEENGDSGGGMSYWRFLAMIATSTAVMLGLMYLNTFALDHVFWSETRFWMALIMGAAMAIIMLSFMLGMYRDPMKNGAIYVGAVVVFAASLWLVRSQQTIGDVDYMKAMIPHHSIAVMTSERAHIRDPRTRELAKAIITAQRREIAEMRYLIADIQENGVRPHARARSGSLLEGVEKDSPGGSSRAGRPTEASVEGIAHDEALASPWPEPPKAEPATEASGEEATR